MDRMMINFVQDKNVHDLLPSVLKFLAEPASMELQLLQEHVNLIEEINHYGFKIHSFS